MADYETVWSSDDCGWWWVDSEADATGAELGVRSAKVGMVRVRYSQFHLVPSEGDVQSFVTKILDGPDQLILHVGQIIYINEGEMRFLTLDHTTLDTYRLTFSPSSTLNPPLFLRDEEFVIDYEGYGSSTYYLYISSAHEKWKRIGQHYWGTIIASREPVNDTDQNGNGILKGRIDGIPVTAQYLGWVKIKSTKSYELNRPLSYVEQSVAILNTVQGSKRTIVSGVTTESKYSGGSLVCGFVWQADFSNCHPIYFGIEFETDTDMVDYFDQITLKSWVVPKTIDINTMVQSGRISIPLWPDRYFYKTQGSMIGVLPSGEYTGYGLNKIYQISTENGVIGGIMPSVGDNIFVLLESNPLNKLIPDEMASLGKVPITIKKAAALVKRPAGGPSLLLELDSTESTMTTDLSQAVSTTTTFTSTTSPPPEILQELEIRDFAYIPHPITTFELPLISLSETGIQYVTDSAYGRRVSITAESDDRTGLPYTAYLSGGGQRLTFANSKEDEGDVDTILPGPDFILSTDLFIDVQFSYDTISISLCDFYASVYPPQNYLGGMNTWLKAHLYRIGHFWIAWCEASQIDWGSFCTKFALSDSTIPLDTWFNLTLTRSSETNEYTWYLNDKMLLDRRSRECGWKSNVYFDTGPGPGITLNSDYALLSCNNGKVFYKNVKLQKGTSLPTKSSAYYISDCAGVMSTAPVIEYDWLPGLYYLGNATEKYQDMQIQCQSVSGTPGFITQEQFLHNLCMVSRGAATLVEEAIPFSGGQFAEVRWEYGWIPSYVYCGESLGSLGHPDGGMVLAASSYALREDQSGYEFKEVKVVVHSDPSLGRDPMRMSAGYRVEMYMKFPQVSFVSTLLSGYAVEDTPDNIVPWEITLSYYNGSEVGGCYGLVTIEGIPFRMGPDFIFSVEEFMTYFRFEREAAGSIIRFYMKRANYDWQLVQDVDGNDCEYQYDRTLLEVDSTDQEYYIMSMRESENSWGYLSQDFRGYYKSPQHRLYLADFRISHYLPID
jgi:hypothetical protein